MSIPRTLFGIFLVASVAFGQLTMDQKIADFRQLASLYAKHYAPYEWKRDALGFDLLQIAPWLDKVRATTDDLGFYEVMSEYVSSLNDAHDVYALPANFRATLNFTVDIFDGKLLVDSINRARLPAAEFPFLTGYELASIDGQDAQQMLDGLLRYATAANVRSTRRNAAALLTTHPQVIMPHATGTPDISTVLFRRPDGNLESYRIPWAKSGLPLMSVGRYATPQLADQKFSGAVSGDEDLPPPGEDAGYVQPPKYLEFLRRLQNFRVPDRGLVGFGQLAPVFARALPSTFVQRLGTAPDDPFFSGVFGSGGLKIGFIRIPDYAPFDLLAALDAFQEEIAFLEANTDGLVVDVTRNPGGYGDYTNYLLSLVIPYRWRSLGSQLRATSGWVVEISTALEQAIAEGAPRQIIDLLQAIKDEITAANHEFRGLTAPLPLDDVTLEREPATDPDGNIIAYDKPLILLVDEFSASAAERFAATIQDNMRGPLVGWRTMGAGGCVVDWEAGSYSLGAIGMTECLTARTDAVITDDYPAAPYIENIGVRPDVQVDYMTRDNLMQNGKPFVDAFTAVIVDHIQKNRQGAGQ